MTATYPKDPSADLVIAGAGGAGPAAAFAALESGLQNIFVDPETSPPQDSMRPVTAQAGGSMPTLRSEATRKGPDVRPSRRVHRGAAGLSVRQVEEVTVVASRELLENCWRTHGSST